MTITDQTTNEVMRLFRPLTCQVKYNIFMSSPARSNTKIWSPYMTSACKQQKSLCENLNFFSDCVSRPCYSKAFVKKETFCCRVVAAPPSTRTALRWRRKYLRIVMLASNPSMVPEDTLIGYFNNIDRQWRDSGNIFLKWFLTYFVSHLFLAGTDSECQRRDSGNSERESNLVEPCLSCVWQVAIYWEYGWNLLGY